MKETEEKEIIHVELHSLSKHLALTDLIIHPIEFCTNEDMLNLLDGIVPDKLKEDFNEKEKFFKEILIKKQFKLSFKN